MNPRARICLIEDDASARASLARVLIGEGHEVVSYPDGESGLRGAMEEEFNLVLTDLRMPGISGIKLVETLRNELPNMPVVLMTAHGTTEIAIEATRLGAFDYILKPFEMEELIAIISRALTAGERARDRGTSAPERSALSALVGNSRPMQNLYKEIGRVAEKPVTVLLMGETGTGKELVARALWQHSDRRTHPLIAINCAAIPAALLESELFGHEKGAFTGADQRRIGRFEQANGGTLLLDEIGDLSLETQAKLLRVLQERVVSRVGGRESISVDVRVIAATHRDLPALVAAGKFREDLWYRLNVVLLRLPPLRERKEDLFDLVMHFVARHGAELGGVASVQPAAIKFFSTQPWPGNVRELENVVKRALLLAHGYVITEELARAASTPGSFGNPAANQSARTLAVLCQEAIAEARLSPGLGAANVTLTAVERELLAQTYAATSGNISQMAQILGWSRLTIREKLKLYGLRREPSKSTGATG